MYSVIFILVYCVLCFEAAISNNIQTPQQSTCRDELIYDVKGSESLMLDDGVEKVYFECQASINSYDGYSQLHLLGLNITDSSKKLLKNPAGWELPIKIEESYGNLAIEADGIDTELSRAIKTAVLSLLPSHAVTEVRNINLEKIKAAEDLIKEGYEKIELKNYTRDIIFVMGNTGSGKTTLVQWLAGDRNKLIAKEVIAGLGEFIIEDDQDKISRSSIYSKTSFPELVSDSETNSVYCDLPGFSDTRNSTLDIANSYFIKKVLDHASSVKLIFTVSYPSVKLGVNRYDFIELLRHATTLINDIIKFENSIVLVVTKVDNVLIQPGSTKFIDDDKIISGIASFMAQCIKDLEERIKNEQPNASVIFYEKAIDLIKILLYAENNEYKRICIFRRPSEVGTLVASDLLEKERRRARNILHYDTFFTFSNDKDFKHTLSDNTKAKINHLSNAVDISLLNSICSIANRFQVFVMNLVKEIYFRIDVYNSLNTNLHSMNVSDIEALLLKLTYSYKVINELEFNIRNAENISTLEINIETALTSLNMSLALAKNLSEYGHYLDFLNEISETKTSISPIAWASSFHKVIAYIVVEQKRIQNGLLTFSHYNDNLIKMKIIRAGSAFISLFKNKEMKNNDVTFLSNEFTSFYDRFFKTLQSSNKHKIVQNIYEVIDILNSVNIYLDDDVVLKIFAQNEYKEILNRVIIRVIDYLDESQKWYKFLIRLYRYISRYDVQKNVTALKLLSKEIKISTSDLIVQDSFVVKLLTKYFQELFQREYEIIKDITLDQYKLYHLQQLIMESTQKPEQLCTDDGRLIVKGHNVKLSDILFMNCPQTVKVIEIFVLNMFYIDCDFERKGESVLFFVIAPIWDVQNKSSILLNGSSGQNHYYRRAPDGSRDGLDGEDGKPGLPGTPGGDFFGIVQNFTNDEEIVISVDGGNGGKGQDGGNGARGSDGTTPNIVDPEKYLKDKGWYYNKYKYHWNFLVNYEYDAIYGKNCTNGGDGGRGGHGGYGGYPGVINFVLLSTQKAYSLRGKKGKTGIHGSVGAPGKAGANGGYAIIDWDPIRKGNKMAINYFNLQNCVSGKVQRNDDVNERGIAVPEKPDFLKPFHVVNDYKKFLRENLVNSAVAYFMHDFLTMLETDIHIQNLYDASGFLDDMLTLETQFTKHHDKTEILSSYRSLLNRINKYISVAKYNNKNDSQELNILNYLRVAIQSKTYKISYDLENYLVIDVKKYFELLTKHIDNYGKSLKEVKIDKYRDHYENTIKLEIRKANMLLMQKIMPEVDNMYVNIDKKIKILVKDIISRKYAKENKKESLLKKQNELGVIVLMKRSVKVLKMITSVIDVYNFVTNLASNALGFESDIERGGLMEVEKNMDNIYELFENEKKCLVNNTYELNTKDEANDNSNIFNSIQNKLQPLLNILKSGYEKYDNYLEEKNRVKTELNKYYNQLLTKKDSRENSNFETDPSIKDQQNKKVSLEIDELKKVQKNIRLSEVCCQNGSLDVNEMSALDSEIEKIAYQIDVLNYFEKLIYDSLPPLRAKLQHNLHIIGLSTVNASHAEIDYNNMKIQNVIQDFKSRMNFMIQIANNEMKNNITTCIDDLQSNMLTVTKINDRINDYYDKNTFSNYIADLYSDAETKNTDSRALNNDVHRLQVMAQSNIILQEYEKAKMAFKQYMFPFVGLYLDQMVLGNQKTNTIESLVQNAIKTVEFLADELSKDASVIKKRTYRIYPNIKFDRLEFEQPPFFVFAGSDYGREISNLLKGEDIILTANITDGLNKNAIKFKEIGIRVVANNETVQSALDLELSQYLIEMTHSGESYYRCDDILYVINHNAISMRHSVQRDNDGMYYYHLDHTSTLIRNNPPMCSPYTTWKVKLVSKNVFNDFSNLSAYENYIKELALEGWGQYTELGLDVCNENLSKFYKVSGNFNKSISLDYNNFEFKKHKQSSLF